MSGTTRKALKALKSESVNAISKSANMIEKHGLLICDEFEYFVIKNNHNKYNQK